MSVDTHKFARGTYLTVSYPWGVNIAGAALCSDGKVRKLRRIAQTADTFFSIPAAVQVNGKTVSGFVTVQTEQGLSTPDESAPQVLKFIAYDNGKNAALLPAGKWLSSETEK